MDKNKLKIWNPEISWEEAEKAWDEKSATLQKTHPLKTLSSLPHMPAIAEKNLLYKSIKYLLLQDPKHIFARYFFKHPLTYTFYFIRSLLASLPYTRDGDFFLYGLDDVEDFQKKVKQDKTVLVVGFSYCHKPHECPSGRFSSKCEHAIDSPVCRQCFIGKVMHALPAPQKNIYPLFITTIHHLGEEMFKLKEKHPDHQLLFLITACEMTLHTFSHWGNMIQAKGIGIRLDGRVCNTMQAFRFSEKGIKPGLTLVTAQTQARFLRLIRALYTNPSAGLE